MSELSKMLREARKRAGLTHDALAGALGVTQSAVSHIERGDRGLSSEVLWRWAEVCGAELQLVGPDHDALTAATRALSAEHAALVLRVARLAPGLNGGDALALAALLDGWEPRSPAARAFSDRG